MDPLNDADLASVSSCLHRIAAAMREQGVTGPYRALMSRSAFNQLLDGLGGFLVVHRLHHGKVRYGDFEIEIWDA